MKFKLAPQNLPRVVIVGAGFGGLKCARMLKDAPAHVTVIDRSNHHLFQPLLYQVATAGLSPADIASPIRSVLKNQPNTEVVLDTVTGIDKQSRHVFTADGRRFDYDYLVIATGARHGYFGHENWEKYAPGLKSVQDATHIRRNILLAFEEAELEPSQEKKNQWLTFVIVGGGPTGVELAGALSELANRALASDFRHIDPKSAKIILVEAGPRLLAAFPENLARRARRALEKLGVVVRVNTRVTDVSSDAVFTGGESILSKTVIWAAGVVASPAATWLEVTPDRAGRVPVKFDLTIEGHPEIFVIGDTAHAEENGKMLPGVAPVALQQGAYVASVIRTRLRGGAVYRQFHYRDKGNLATVGRSFAVADIGKIKLSGFSAWLAWIAVHIYYLIGFRNRLLVMIQWAWAYLTFQRGARLIVFEEGKQRR